MFIFRKLHDSEAIVKQRSILSKFVLYHSYAFCIAPNLSVQTISSLRLMNFLFWLLIFEIRNSLKDTEYEQR